MASNFAFVVRHCSFWRGNVHRWSTVYPFVNTGEGSSMTDAGLDTMAHEDAAWCYFGPDGDQGAVYAVDFYSLDVGGSPLLSKTYADASNPNSGTVPSGTDWTVGGALAETNLECSMLVEWSGGLGKT